MSKGNDGKVKNTGRLAVGENDVHNTWKEYFDDLYVSALKRAF